MKQNETKLSHGGDWAGFTIEYGTEPMDFSMNVNPLGIAQEVQQAIAKAGASADRYPDPLCRALVQRLADHEGIPSDLIFCGNGAADIIFRLARALGDDAGSATADRRNASAAAGREVASEAGRSATTTGRESASEAGRSTTTTGRESASEADRSATAAGREVASEAGHSAATAGRTPSRRRRPVLLITAPTFSEYATAFAGSGWEIRRYLLREERGFRVGEDILKMIGEGTDAVFLCEPNNPTGVTTERQLLQKILQRCRETGTWLVVDECFNGFLEDPGAVSLKRNLQKWIRDERGAQRRQRDRELTARAPGAEKALADAEVSAAEESLVAEKAPAAAKVSAQNGNGGLIILKAFTKLYGMAGVRLGYCLCSGEGIVERLRAAGPPWNVSTLAQAAGIAALDASEHTARGVEIVQEERPWMKKELQRLGIRRVYGEANYLLFYVDADDRTGSGREAMTQSDGSGGAMTRSDDREAKKPIRPLYEELRRRGILIRDCSNYEGLSRGWYRIAIRTHEENRLMMETLKDVLTR